MILVAFLALALALVPLAGGSLRRLGTLRLRAPGLLLLALASQVALIALPGPGTWWRVGLNVALYPLGLAFVWLNRRVPGMRAIGLGAACNLVAILANGGVMPASAAAMRAAGIQAEPGLFANSAVLEHPRLLFLGDVIAIPRPLPLANVLSVGDVIIALGAAYLLHRVSGSRLTPARRSG